MKVRGVVVKNSLGKNSDGQVTAEVEIEPLKTNWEWHGLEYMASLFRVQRHGISVALQPQEARVLSSLVMRGGAATTDEIYLDAWDFIPQISRRLVTHISFLRKKLRPLGIDIEGMRNRGYCLIDRDDDK